MRELHGKHSRVTFKLQYANKITAYNKAFNIYSYLVIITISFLSALIIVNPEKWFFLLFILPIIFFFIKPYYALITFVFLLPFEPSLAGVNVFVSFLKFFGLIMFFIFIINKLVKRDLSFLTKIPNSNLLMIFLSLLFISAVFSTDRETSLIQFLTYLQLFLFYVIFITFIDDKNKFVYLIIALLLAAGTNAIYAIYNHYFSSVTVFSSELSRETGFYDNANRFGYIQSIISFLAFPFVLNLSNRFVRYSLFLLIIIIILSSFLSFSRGGFIALIVALLYALHAFSKNKKCFLGLMGAFLIAMILVPNTFWDRSKTIIYRDAKEGSIPTRLAFIKDGFRMVFEHPLTGVGLGRFKEEFSRYSYENVSSHAGGAHNMYISIMAENGIPALIVFLLLLYKTLNTAISYRSSAEPDLNKYLMGIDIAVVFALIAGFFGTIEYSKIFWLLLALCAAIEKINESPQNKNIIYN